MKLVALDLATQTGWATYVDEKVESGSVSFKVKRGESAGMRFVKFSAWLKKILDDVEPDLIIYEQAHHRGGAATEVGVGLSTRVQEAAAARGINYTSVHTATLKKATTGKGRASKEQMIRAARDIFPLQKIEDDNQADALCILHWAMKKYGGAVE